MANRLWPALLAATVPAGPRRAGASVAILALAVAILLPSAARAAIDDGVVCDCYYGTLVTFSPCSCVCPSPWLPPRCNFRASSIVQMRVLATTVNFTSELWVNSIRDGLGDSAVSFMSKTFAPVTYNGRQLYDIRLTLDGHLVAPFLAAVDLQSAAWVTRGGIVAADLAMRTVAVPFEAHQVMIYDDGAKVQISLGHLGFAAGALVLAVVMVIVETCCCGVGYSEKQLEAEEELDATASRYAAMEAEQEDERRRQWELEQQQRVQQEHIAALEAAAAQQQQPEPCVAVVDAVPVLPLPARYSPTEGPVEPAQSAAFRPLTPTAEHDDDNGDPNAMPGAVHE
jgi:hypothetical protein